MADEKRTVPVGIVTASKRHRGVVGKPTPRLDGRLKVTGRARYTADIALPGRLHARVVRSPHPHARIRAIDTSAAERHPGVRAVHVLDHLLGSATLTDPSKELKSSHPVVRYAGQPIAAVAAATPVEAEEAARLVRVDYELLPFVVDLDEAREADAPLVFPGPAQQGGTGGGGGGASGVDQVGNVRGPPRAHRLEGAGQPGEGSGRGRGHRGGHLPQTGADPLAAGDARSGRRLEGGPPHDLRADAGHGFGARRAGRGVRAGQVAHPGGDRVHGWRLRRQAGLGAAPGALSLQRGKVVVGDGDGRSLGFRQAAARMRTEQVSATAPRAEDYGGSGQRLGPTFRMGIGGSGGVQFAAVRVDTETGIIAVDRVVAVHDCGRPLNPIALENQVKGGVLQGISYALHENRVLDRGRGLMLNPNFEQYKILGAREVPHIDVVMLEVYRGRSSTDAGGIGEPATVPTAAAVANAVYNAIGVRVRELPMTPARVLAAMAGTGRHESPRSGRPDAHLLIGRAPDRVNPARPRSARLACAGAVRLVVARVASERDVSPVLDLLG